MSGDGENAIRRIPGAVLVTLAAELSPLGDLAGWEPAALRLSALQAALNGSDGISDVELQTLRGWARRWRRLVAPVRQFYAYMAPRDVRVSGALRAVLQGERVRMSDPRRWGVRDAWTKHYGYPPPFDLTPRLED